MNVNCWLWCREINSWKAPKSLLSGNPPLRRRSGGKHSPGKSSIAESYWAQDFICRFFHLRMDGRLHGGQALSWASLFHPGWLAKQVPSKYFPTERLKSKDCLGGSICSWTHGPQCAGTVDLPGNRHSGSAVWFSHWQRGRSSLPSVGVSQVIFFPLMSSKQSCFSGSALKDSVSSLSPPLACFQTVPFACLTYRSHFLPALPELPRVGFLIECFAQNTWQDLDNGEVSIQWHT